MSKFLSPESEFFLEKNSHSRRTFQSRYAYYHEDNLRYFQKTIQHDSIVLIVGCNVSLLSSRLKAQEIHVLELDPGAAKSGNANVRNIVDLDDSLSSTAFDYVILPYTMQYLLNIQETLETLRKGMRPHARLLVLQYNFLWAPLIKLAERWKLKAPTPDLNWLSPADVENLLTLSNYQQIATGYRCLIPLDIPFVTSFVNTYIASLPLIRNFCQKTMAISRPWILGAREHMSVTIVVPARNEAGNIAGILDRLPVIGLRCEVIFVEGHSRDNTWEEIQRQIAVHPRRRFFEIQSMRQTGEGKADAVRLGFESATGDLLLILDADLSVRPEDLVYFYNAIYSGAAEFANGSRLVYKMEQAAMQILNLFFNKQFGALLSWLIRQPVKDSLCGTKAISRRDYLRIRRSYAFLGEKDPFGDFELLFGAGCLNLKICDVPVWYKQRTYGSTNIRRFHHGWQLLKMCLRSWSDLQS